jgi:hypothetical protein
MKTTWFTSKLALASTVLVLLLAAGTSASAQQFTVAMFRPETVELSPPVKAIQPEPLLPEAPHHKFWDRENKVLFGAVAAAAGADFAVTHANLANGGRELNPITRVFSGSTPGLAVNFAGETAGVIGLSYMFHKTGHHKLERLTPMANLGASAAAVSYGLAHR